MGQAPALIIDAGPLYAAADAADPLHRPATRLLSNWEGELVVSAFVAAEADHLILNRLGVDTQAKFVRGLASAFTVAGLDGPGLAAAADICERYRDLKLGVADASTVVLADRWRTTALATFDERHFRAVAPLGGEAFELLPADAS